MKTALITVFSFLVTIQMAFSFDLPSLSLSDMQNIKDGLVEQIADVEGGAGRDLPLMQTINPETLQAAIAKNLPANFSKTSVFYKNGNIVIRTYVKEMGIKWPVRIEGRLITNDKNFQVKFDLLKATYAKQNIKGRILDYIVELNSSLISTAGTQITVDLN